MAAGTSIIQREISLSTLSISQPAVINSRPFSHRIRSAHILVPESQLCSGLERSFITPGGYNFSHTETTGVSLVEPSLPHHENSQHQKKSSTFANFRLLQRLAFSAKGKVSCDAGELGPQDHTDDLNSEGDNKNHPGVTFRSDSPVGNALSLRSPCLDDPDPKVSGKKSQKRRTKKSVKKIKPPQVRQRELPADVNNLRLAANKAVPTFSKRFNRHRKTHDRKNNLEEQHAHSFPCGIGTNSNSFSEGTSQSPPEDQCISTKSLTLNNLVAGLGCPNTPGESTLSSHNSDSVQEASLRAIYERCPTASQSVPLNRVRLKKLFQSEKQSGSITECGKMLPCAPPASPTPLLLEKYEIIPSLADFRSQQSIKQRLKALREDAKKKESIKERQKKQQELEALVTQQEERRIRTRQEIYALNRIMTKLERDHFKKFQESMKNR